MTPTFPHEMAEALADDAEALAALHDRELNAELLAALRAVDFPHSLGLLPDGEQTKEVWRLMSAALPLAPGATTLEQLAVDYAAIYLTGAYGASPCESVWTDDEHLACQAAMFALRDIYAMAGLVAEDWRRRPDDHLVLQLLYLSHVLRRASGPAELRRLAAMMDEHLLRWLPDFAERVASRCETPFYAVLGRLTFVWCEQVRDLLSEWLGEPRPARKDVKARVKTQRVESAPLAYMPGASPSW